MNQRTTLCLVWIFGTLGASGIVASCVTTYWQTSELFKTNLGLWKQCIFSICKVQVYHEGNDQLNATKALMVIGIIVIGITNLLNIIGTCCAKNFTVPLIVLEIIAIGCVIAALVLYTLTLKQSALAWGWSYMVGWAGVGLYAVSFIFLCIAVCQS